MFVKQFLTGGDRNFGYMIADESSRKALIIDPSYAPEMLTDFADEHNYTIEYVFNTHGHYDHTNGNSFIQGQSGKTALLYGDFELQSGLKVEHQARFPLGSLEIVVLHTPGHTEDSICLYIGNAVFTGDTLFVGKVGGTDLGRQARAEYESLHQVLMQLPDETRVFPGHNYGTAPESTIQHERDTNPFLLQKDFDSFVDLKRSWAAYKKAHGIA